MLISTGIAIKKISSLSLDKNKEIKTKTPISPYCRFFRYSLKTANFYPSHLISTILKSSVKTTVKKAKITQNTVGYPFYDKSKDKYLDSNKPQPKKQIVMRFFRMFQEQIYCNLKFPLFNRITQ